MWSLRIALSRLRPFNASSITRLVIVVALMAAFLYGDYMMFRRLFRAIAQVEVTTPFFALGLLRNLLAMVFLVATVVLFSSAATSAIGAFFTDLDLDVYHTAPISRLRIILARWLKTLVQSATIVFLFLVPLFVAFGMQYDRGFGFYATGLGNLALLLTIPVSLASLTIIVLVRWFPVQRVHQIVASLAILVISAVVVAFRMSRPERFFSEISTDNVVIVLRSIELPSMDIYPGTALAQVMTRPEAFPLPARIAVPALVFFAVFLAVALRAYFIAFVRARESMAPVALGSAWMTRVLDRMFSHASAPTRALVGKEIRTLGRDVAQWSQVFLMVALLFVYLYNIRMLPLGGDSRAAIVAYANLGMAGFVVAAICLRFAFPAVSAEGKAFWLVQTAPVSYRRVILVKVLVFGAPLTLLALLLTAFANVILGANAIVWSFTLFGASLLAVTLVSLGVGMGALAPNFNAENPLQVGLSLGGFAYMALSMAYVGLMMFLMARPITRYVMWRVFNVGHDHEWLSAAAPLVTGLTVSVILAVVPLLAAERRLTRLGESD